MIAFNTNKVKKMIENKIHHPYVQQHIDEPFIDLKKIATLCMIYDEVSLNKQHKYDEIISIMLVQTALDTHELVTTKSAQPSDEIERQLTVLAGDFYSGLYYRTLAEIDEIDLVRALANAIKLVNEKKMILYEYEFTNWNELIEAIRIIEAILFTNVGRLYELSDANIEYINEYLLINRLTKEMEAINMNQFSYIEQYVDRKLIEPYEPSVIFLIEREIERCYEKINNVKDEPTFSFGNLTNFMYEKKMLSAVEEG